MVKATIAVLLVACSGGCSGSPDVVEVHLCQDGGVEPAVVDCALVSVGTLCNSAGHTCTPDARCAPFEWGEMCGVGECPPFPCQQALCVHEACMRWHEEDGTACFGENGQCSGGECKIKSPQP
jgi:hypothetical protein